MIQPGCEASDGRSVFDAVSNATRREILLVLLRAGEAGIPELSVSAIAARAGIVRPLVSRHLAVLRTVGAVSVRRVRTFSYYAVDSSALTAIEDWLLPFLELAERSSARRLA